VRLNLAGLVLPFLIAGVLAPLGAALAAALIPRLLEAAPAAQGPLRLGWYAFMGIACAAGAKALRARHAGWIFAAAGAAGLAVGILAGRLA
jgi:hypothetical protein